ncbi:hypothetical protein [Changchengzhania lutea]|nr:hypothetical protein [Changchengzhania lutea]
MNAKIIVINGVEYEPVVKTDPEFSLLENYYEKQLLQGNYFKNKIA